MTSHRYVPNILLNRVSADGGELPSGPRGDACDGVLLFADITGFTELMTRQTDLGRAGMEEFAFALNGYFGELIERITAAGGDVVTFAGDALLALFQGEVDETSLAPSVRAAKACAEGIQRDLHRRDVGGGVRLSTRITITAGRAMFLQAGGHKGRWELFLTGDVTQQIAATLRGASAGQVVLSQEAAALIGAPANRRSLRDPPPSYSGPPSSMGDPPPSGDRDSVPPSRRSTNPPSAPVSEAALKPFVPSAVQFWTGREQFLGEVRAVTACFVRLVELDLSKPEALELANARIRTLQEIVERYEGDVNKVFSDEKGLAAVLAWGLPTRSHEDDAARALHAAKALAEALKVGSEPPSIGVATGAVYCGLIGNDRRCEYSILGSPVNIAARLMQASKGSILCEQSTAQLAKASFEFSPPVARSLKGLVRPVLVTSPTAARALSGDRPAARCIGRAVELSQLTERMSRVSSEGRKAVVMVEAEAGMGKSTLLAALVDSAKAAAFRVLFGEAQAVERRVAYHPFRSVLAELLGLRSTSDLERVPGAVAAVVRGDPWLEERAPLLSAILPAAIPETPFLSELASDEARADNLHALVVRLIDKIAGSAPVALVLDDVHWFDSTSWALLGALVRSLPRALFALGSRPIREQPAADYESLREDPATLRLTLKGLSEAELFSMVARELGVASLPDALQQVLKERSEGNPFYAIELALTLRDKGLVAVHGGVCRVTTDDGSLRADVLPGTIQGLVQARFDRLGAEEQTFLKVASVLGRTFDLADVAAIVPDQQADAGAVAERLLSADMLQREGGGRSRYEFRHAIACDAVYDSLLLTQRRELHRSVVTLLEGRVDGGDRGRSHGLLAYHARRAEDWPKAVRYLDLAASEALARYANAECRKAVEGALAIIDERRVSAPDAQIAGWHWHASIAAFRMGAMDACIDHGRSALDRYGAPLPKRALGSFTEVSMTALRRTWGSRPKSVPGADLDETTRGRILDLYHCLVDAFGYKVDAGGLITTILREMDLAEAIGDSGLVGHARLMLFFVLCATPFAARVRRWVDECEALVAQPMETRTRASLLVRLCAAHGYAGAFAEAQRCGKEAARLAREAGEMRVLGDASSTTYQMMHAEGRYRETEGDVQRLLDVARLTGNRQFETAGVIGLVDRSMRLGRGAELRSRMEEVAAWIESSAMPADYVYGQGVRALAALYAEDHAAAIASADAAVARAAKTDFPVWWMLQGFCGAGDVYMILAARAAQEGSTEAADLRKKLGALVAQMRRYLKLFAFSDLFLRFYEGKLLELSGKKAKAERAWREGLAGTQSENTRYIRARTFCALGRSLGGDSAEGAEALAEGRRVLTELGAVEPEEAF